MQKITLSFALVCIAPLLHANDSTRTEQQIAGKDAPFPIDESTLPEETPNYDGTYPSQNRTTPSQGRVTPPQGKKNTEQKFTPEVNSSKSKAGKDIFPPEDAG